MGCDSHKNQFLQTTQNFNSHTPCGVRLISLILTGRVMDFNSHTPCGVRHNINSGQSNGRQFQLTHPMWGATKYWIHSGGLYVQFQLTHPMWGATYNRQLSYMTRQFQLTHPMWGATLDFVKKIRTALYMLGWTYEILLFKIKIYANYAANLSQYSYYYRFA